MKLEHLKKFSTYSVSVKMLFWLAIFIVLSESSQNSDHMCSRMEPYQKMITLSKVVTYTYWDYGFWNDKRRLGAEEEVYSELRYFTKMVMECCSGYSPHKGVCTPICHGGCINGNCTSPQQCTCHEGYEKLTQSRCIPHCDQCTHGYCTAPNTCHCYPGYSENKNGVCQPNCKKTCRNGLCTQPEHCSCFPGYKLAEDSIYDCLPICDPPCDPYKIKGSQCVKPNECACPEGYKISSNGKECLPVCYNCKYGNCTAPNHCDCWDGYEKFGNNICSPKCTGDCINSFCSSPENCTCFDGYNKTYEKSNKCEPICDNVICEYGDCVAPNECQCWKGYEWNSTEKICTPICSESCINGFCSEPETCTCLDGFDLDLNDDPYICLPICTNCENGNCTAPYECNCWEGYQKNDINENCFPICSNDCINGFCSSPETCTCFEGYELIENNTYLCLPICESCENGNCTEPGNCTCWDSYEWNEFSKTCKLIMDGMEEDSGNLTLNLSEQNMPNVDKTFVIWISSSIFGVMIVLTTGLILYFRRKVNNKKKRLSATYTSIIYAEPNEIQSEIIIN